MRAGPNLIRRGIRGPGIGGILPFHVVQPLDNLQTAVTSAAADGRHIWMWPGTWTLLAPLVIPAGAQIYIWGCGRDTIIETTGAAPDPMFQLAAGVVEFQLHDLTINRRGFAGTTIQCLGACTSMYIDNVVMNLVDGAIGTDFITQAAAGNITNLEIEYSDLDGILDLRGVGMVFGVAVGRAQIHDSQLDAVAGGHNFGDSAVVYSSRNRWLGGIGGVGVTVTVDGANAFFRDEGSHYTGDCALHIADGDANVRGCYLFADADVTIFHDGGSLRMGTCEVVNNSNRTCVLNDAGADYIGIRNCHFLVTPAGIYWGVNLLGCVGQIVGNKFENCGFSTDYSCTFDDNTMEAVVNASAIRVRANRVVITGNNILACAQVAGIAIELYDNDNNVVKGNQLQGYTVHEDVGATGNVIEANRVAA